MNDAYHAERRAVSREMRRMAARRNISVATAIGCVLVAIILAIVTVIDSADANETEQANTVELVLEAAYSMPDDSPVLGTIISAPKRETKKQSYSEEELEMLALVIYQEAGGDACSDSTRRMVAEVVLNRIDHPMYPNTMEGVLTQYGQYGRLHWTGLVWPERAKYEVERHAVEREHTESQKRFLQAITDCFQEMFCSNRNFLKERKSWWNKKAFTFADDGIKKEKSI